jgi:hypothetical protein
LVANNSAMLFPPLATGMRSISLIVSVDTLLICVLKDQNNVSVTVHVTRIIIPRAARCVHGGPAEPALLPCEELSREIGNGHRI